MAINRHHNAYYRRAGYFCAFLPVPLLERGLIHESWAAEYPFNIGWFGPLLLPILTLCACICKCLLINARLHKHCRFPLHGRCQVVFAWRRYQRNYFYTSNKEPKKPEMKKWPSRAYYWAQNLEVARPATQVPSTAARWERFEKKTATI